jgi:predicted Fe-Mo cluster-binding NifX family protein
MDVDIHGPSIPQMLGLGPGAMRMDDTGIGPAVYGADLKVASIECMMDNTESPVIWRGPLKANFIRQFISDVAWGELDYLVVDSPPGTGDEPLTIAQTIPGIRALIVTTPQEVSLRDVRKSINFCREADMPILGLVENMSGLRCPHCNLTINLFKTGGGEDAARAMQINFLGRIPIIPDVVTAGDAGQPPLEVSVELQQSFGPILDGIVNSFPNSDRILPQRNASTSSMQAESTVETNSKKEDTVTRIALPMAGNTVCMHFGHCEKFALIDVDPDAKKIIKTEMAVPPPHEPGVLPRWLHERGANVIIAGGMGARAQALFAENNIKVIYGASTEEPQKLVQDYLQGKLKTGDNVCDH